MIKSKLSPEDYRKYDKALNNTYVGCMRDRDYERVPLDYKGFEIPSWLTKSEVKRLNEEVEEY